MGARLDTGGGSSLRTAGASVANTLNKIGKSTVKKPTVKKTSAPRASTSRSYGGYSYSTGMGNRGSSSQGRSAPSYSGGGGSSRGGGGGAPSINSYLGTDDVYQSALSGSKRSLADFLSELGRRRGEANTSFNLTKSSMERDRLQQLDDLRQEYASRGLIQSGIYGEEQGKFQKQFTEQSDALQQQQAALLADLLSQEKNYRRESDLATQQAKQEALQRRAARYKIGA